MNTAAPALDINLAMSANRLYEALKAEARRTNDPVLVRRWNDYCSKLSRKLDEQSKRNAGTDGLAWFYSQGFHAAR